MKKLILGLLGWELFWWARRYDKRQRMYRAAMEAAIVTGRPLLVVGPPDRGFTGGYGCGDIALDIGPSKCPVFIQADITKPLPLNDNSVVAFVSCVLEYVDDIDAAMRELKRVAGDHLYIARVEPWTLAAALYPGRRRVLVRGKA